MDRREVDWYAILEIYSQVQIGNRIGSTAGTVCVTVFVFSGLLALVALRSLFFDSPLDILIYLWPGDCSWVSSPLGSQLDSREPFHRSDFGISS